MSVKFHPYWATVSAVLQCGAIESVCLSEENDNEKIEKERRYCPDLSRWVALKTSSGTPLAFFAAFENVYSSGSDRTHLEPQNKQTRLGSIKVLVWDYWKKNYIRLSIIDSQPESIAEMVEYLTNSRLSYPKLQKGYILPELSKYSAKQARGRD